MAASGLRKSRSKKICFLICCSKWSIKSENVLSQPFFNTLNRLMDDVYLHASVVTVGEPTLILCELVQQDVLRLKLLTIHPTPCNCRD